MLPDAYVRIAWQDAPMDSGALRAVYEHALHLLIRSGLTKILPDHGQMAPFQAADRDWMLRTWVPRAVAEAGYRHCAIVESKQVFNRLGTRHLVMELGTSTLAVAYFDEAAAADAWLRQL